MRSGRIILMAVLGMLALFVASSRGQTLNLGAGTKFEGSLTNQPLINSGTLANDGLVSSWVISDPSVNSGGYIFIYEMENQGPDTITGVNFNNFSPSQFFSSEVVSNVSGGSLPGHLTPTVTLSPTFTFDTITAGGAATFNGALAMGATSWYVVIDTDVTSFNTGYALTQDDFQAHGEILAPNFAVYGVPEPSSAALILLAGCACFYAVLRWRRTMDN